MSLTRTHIYTVHVLPGQSAAVEKPVFVKEGFNFFAFIFTFFWALYHRCWLFALLIASAYAVLTFMQVNHLIDQEGFSIVQLGINILIGFQANDALRARLTRKGYILADITTGDTLLRAEQRYFERYVAMMA